MSSKTSPILLVEYYQLQYVKYDFGGASGGVFGFIIEVEAVLGIETITWNALVFQKSYNFRELGNSVYKLEKDAAERNLIGTDTFMFTDNTTDEADHHNKTSSSPEFFELVI